MNAAVISSSETTTHSGPLAVGAQVELRRGEGSRVATIERVLPGKVRTYRYSDGSERVFELVSFDATTDDGSEISYRDAGRGSWRLA